MLKYSPAVFVVGNTYQIMVPVTDASLFWIEVDGERFYDEQNGIMRSLCSTHRVSVPMDILDRAGQYTVCERTIIDRKPYFPETAEPVETCFVFHPLPEDPIRIYHVADTHNRVTEPGRAAEKFGQIDLLVMNGDIPDHSGSIANFDTIYEIAAEITHGSIPIVFARGNHDLRGYHAEEIADHTPNQYGNTYYSFRIGGIWGLVLDCGEDKDDSHPEYGHTVACHAFRERQTTYIRALIDNAANEYDADGIRHKLIICHNPFTMHHQAPFGIEQEIYTEWARLIREHIRPDWMLCGHIHSTFISEIGGPWDYLGQPCPVVVGSQITRDSHTGCGIVLHNDREAEISFVCSK